MSSYNMNSILGKLDELRAVFVLGQRAVPFLEEILSFLKEISPLLDDINASIRDSTHKMPHATTKLQSVTQATELATTEILDLVDASLLQLGEAKARQSEGKLHLEAIGRVDARMIRLLRAELKSSNPEVLAEIEMLHEEKKALRRNALREVQMDLNGLDEVREKLNRIMISLQVQDITAQQIAAVNHLIESIRKRMARLVTRLAHNSLGEVAADVAEPTEGVSFDPHAQYDFSGVKQGMADEVVASFGSAEPGTVTDQSAIDQLFSAGGDGVAANDEAEVSSGATEEAASQDEINQLFGGAPTNEAASQDDIDKLFQGGF